MSKPSKKINSSKKDNLHVFEKLYANNYENLCVYLLNYTNDKDKIEDIVQETFLNLWSKRNKIMIKDSIESYLYRSAYNKLMDTFRKKKKIENMLDSYYYTALIRAIKLDDDKKNERIKKLNKCINKLPKRCKEVFTENKISGKKHQQVATDLNISLKTVEGHITNAFKQIKKCMSA